MAFFGHKSCHEECGVRIMDYLEKREGNERAVAFDSVSLGGSDLAKGRWASFMDATRKIYGNHTAYGDKKCVTYHHFVISPDPNDDVDISTLRALTMDWVTYFFGDDIKSGILGSYEVAVVYHDDNVKGIPHAHVVVNNTNFDTGNRLHIDDDQNKLLFTHLQKVCQEYGLSHFDENHEKQRVREDGRFFSKSERKLIGEGRFSWKQDIANNVVIARRLSRTESEFTDMCDELGIGVEVKDDDYMYTHKSNENRWRVSGYRLGGNYQRDAILESLKTNADKHEEDLARMRKNVALAVLREYFDEVEDKGRVTAFVDGTVSIDDAAFALSVNDRYQIRCLEDYDRRLSRFRGLLVSAKSDHSGQNVEKAIEDLMRARDIAQKGDFFVDVDLGRPENDMFTPHSTSSSTASTSGAKSGRDANKSGGRTQDGQRRQTRDAAARRDDNSRNRGR